MHYHIPSYDPIKNTPLIKLSAQGGENSSNKVSSELKKGYHIFRVNTGELAKITITAAGFDETKKIPEFKQYAGRAYFPFLAMADKDIEKFRTGTIEYYDQTHKLLLIDNIDNPGSETIDLLRKKILDRKIFIVTKDKEYPVYNDRLSSLRSEELEGMPDPESGSSNHAHINASEFANSGYYIQDECFKCCGCNFSIPISKFNQLVNLQKTGNELLTSGGCLKIMDKEHKEIYSNFKNINPGLISTAYRVALGAKACLRKIKGKTTLASLHRDDKHIEVQRYLPLEFHEESGRIFLKAVPGCSIIATQPEKQVVNILDLKGFGSLQFEHSELLKEFNKTRDCFEIDKKALGNPSLTDEKWPVYNSLTTKISLLDVLKPHLKKLYSEIDQYHAENCSHDVRLNSSSRLSDIGSPSISEGNAIKANAPVKKFKFDHGNLETTALTGPVPEYVKNAKQNICRLLQELLETINTIKIDDRELEFLQRARHPSRPGGSTSEGVASFRDYDEINPSSIELVIGFTESLQKTLLSPIMELLGEDYWTLHQDIRSKIFGDIPVRV